MSKPSEILSALIAQLKASTDLSFIDDNNFFLGVRDNITQYPCLILEPLETSEGEYVYPKQRLTLRIAIFGFIEVQDDVDKQIVGDATNRGILDVENLVKKAISSDIKLGGYALDTTMKSTLYEYADYPVRGFTINVDVLFEQASTVRT
jgi:hypothetical protein